MGLSPHSALPPRDSNLNAEPSFSAAAFPTERQALESLLASGEFHRSPNLEKILSYLCHQYFQGKGNLVKEYSIATEALDRKEDFDPKRDSIVRVEMHRLRRRLKDYYASKGASNPIRITLPDKSYIPEFVASAMAPAQIHDLPAEAVLPQPQEPNSVWIRVKKNRHAGSPLLLMPIAFSLLFIAGYWWWTKSGNAPSPAQQLQVEKNSPASTAALAELNGSNPAHAYTELRILAGRPKGRYPDRYGVVCMPLAPHARGRFSRPRALCHASRRGTSSEEQVPQRTLRRSAGRVLPPARSATQANVQGYPAPSRCE